MHEAHSDRLEDFFRISRDFALAVGSGAVLLAIEMASTQSLDIGYKAAVVAVGSEFARRVVVQDNLTSEG
jgi:hypothetical protein